MGCTEDPSPGASEALGLLIVAHRTWLQSPPWGLSPGGEPTVRT